MLKRLYILDQKGFTLIEVLSIMVIMGVMASVSAKKFDFLSQTAANRALLEGIKELNIRETLTWTNIKLSSEGWIKDADVFAKIDTNLGSNYAWTSGPNASGGTLSFRSHSIALNRIPSAVISTGIWQ